MSRGEFTFTVQGSGGGASSSSVPIGYRSRERWCDMPSRQLPMARDAATHAAEKLQVNLP